MKRGGVLMGIGSVAALVMLALAAGRAGAALTSGQLLTNFASATYNLPGGANVKGEEQPGINGANVPNSATAWVLITDSPQLCLAMRKDALDPTTGAVITSQYAGSQVVFQISFSNCGGFSGFSVLVTDVLPTNVTKMGAMSLIAIWWAGGSGTVPNIPTPTWASTLLGPWYNVSNAGQVSPMYMRWLLNRVGMHKSGFVRYQVSIN